MYLIGDVGLPELRKGFFAPLHESRAHEIAIDYACHRGTFSWKLIDHAGLVSRPPTTASR